MNSNVRRELCAASLPAWKRHPLHRFTSSRSPSDTIQHTFSSTKRIDYSTTPLFNIPSASLGPPPAKNSKTPASIVGSATLHLGLSSGPWRASLRRSTGFEHKIWDRRKPPGYEIRGCRDSSSSVKTLVYPSEQRLKDPANSKETTVEGHHVPESNGSIMHTSPPAGPTNRSVAPDSTQKHLMDRLPNMPQIHRPSKEELLAAATGFWSRLKVRFKWFSIRSARPFNADEIGAFFSWVLVGHVLWIVLGTTTFFSIAILAVNTVFAQGESRSTPVTSQD